MEKSKVKLAIKMNLEFDEIVDLFSEETLSSMEQGDICGGGTDGNKNGICINVVQCHCTPTNGIVCATVVIPTMVVPTRETPTIIQPTLPPLNPIP